MIALFVLLGVLTFTCELYLRSLGYLSSVERNSRAACFADNVASKLRNWAEDPAHFRATDWAAFANFSDPSFPGFQARVRWRFANTMSPCSAQESGRPAGRQIRMMETVKAVDVEILWEGQALFTMPLLLAEPRRAVRANNPLVVEPVGGLPGQLPPDANQVFRATLYDDSDQEIKDVKFSWGVQAMTGNATITSQARDGLTGTLTNVYIVPPGTRMYVGGSCRVVAAATYFGQEYQGLSAEVQLAGP